MDDTRCALQKGFPLQLQSRNNGTLTLHIRRELGRGVSCIVYEAYYLASNNDRKWIRLKECCPAGLGIGRAADGSLTVPEESLARFEEAKERMKEDFHTLSSLYYNSGSCDSFVSSPDFYSAGNTIYSLFAYDSDSTLADRQPDTLQGCIEIVIKTAKAIRILHDAGYLYLDCKPENILYIQGQTERVQLFDLNCLIRIDSIKDPKGTRPDRILFTPEYAAPELFLGKLSRLGTWTDVYALGALLFWLLFSRTPSISDCLRDAKYPFDQMRFQNPGDDENSTSSMTGNRRAPFWNETLLRKLTEFFHSTLASYCGNRLSDMNAVITALEELVPLADQKAPFLRSSHVDAPQVLLGREDERNKLDEWLFDKDHSFLWITGVWGMGKTALVQDLCVRHRRDIGLLLFLTLQDSLLTSIADDWQVNIAHISRSTSETLREYALRKLSLLQTFAEEDKGLCLLVVDNTACADVLTEEDLALLRELHWKVILISHARPLSYSGETLDLKSLTKDAAEAVFLSFLNPDSAPGGEREAVAETIVLHAGGNPFLLRLIANQIRDGKMTMSAAASLLRGDGSGVSACQGEALTKALLSIWNAEDLTEGEILLLHLAEMFSPAGINLSFLQELTRKSFDKEVSSLLHDGWISLQDGRLCLSSLVLPILEEIPLKEQELEVMEGTLESLEICLSRQDTRLILPQEFFPVLRYRPGKKGKGKTPAEITGIKDAEVLSCSLQALKTLQDSALSKGQAYTDLLFHAILLLPTGEEKTARDLSLLFLNRKTAGGADQKEGLETICGMPGVIADLFVIDYGAYACFVINDREDAASMVHRAEQVLREKFSIPGDEDGKWASYAKALSCYVLGSTDDELLDGDYAPISPDHGKIRQHMLSLDETGIKEAERSEDLDGGRMLAVMLCMEASDILRFYQFPEDRHGLSRIRSGLSLPADRIRVRNSMNRAEEYVGFGKAGEKDLILWICLNRAWYFTVMDRDFQKAYDYLRRCFDLTDFGEKGADHVSIGDIDGCIVPVSDILRTFNRYKDSISVLEQGIDLCKGKAGIAPFDRKREELEDCISDCRAEQEYFTTWFQ